MRLKLVDSEKTNERLVAFKVQRLVVLFGVFSDRGLTLWCKNINKIMLLKYLLRIPFLEKKNDSIVYYQVHVLDDTFKSSFEDNELNSVVN